MSALEVQRIDGVPIARARQDIDAANAAQVREELISLLDGGTHCIVLDLGGVRYIDSAGIDMLFRLSERLRQRRASLQLVLPADSHLRRLMEIVALPSVVPVHETVERARHAPLREQEPC